jgi:hypothetical protein
VYIGEEGGFWTNLNTAGYLQQATPSWQTKIIEFDAAAVFALHKLSFEMGAQNIPMYFDNIKLVETGPGTIPAIEIIGSSIPPDYWNKGVDMPTTDGITYRLLNYTLPAGEVKFRQDQSWTFNWGASSFPTGIGTQNGPNIPVTAGTYNIYFNRQTGAYRFDCATCVYSIGIIGSSVPPYNWQVDVNMQSSDGILYTLQDYYLEAGELRFRQNDDWAVNWGGNSFPVGVGNQFAPNIHVTAGTYNITFNRITGDYSFVRYQPSIALMGLSTQGWESIIHLVTLDGRNYSIPNFPLFKGAVKFRQDDSWEFNWGNVDFPAGTGLLNGPNIPVTTTGNYNISFNRHTHEYNFKLLPPDPIVQCPPNIEASVDAGTCGAVVFFNPPVITTPWIFTYMYQVEGLPSGSFLQVGTYTNTYIIFYDPGKITFCSFTVTVKDTEPPVISQVTADPAILSPANHKMKDVLISYNATDNCGTVTSSLAVTSNQPVNGMGDGDTSPDWLIIDNHHLQLRAERAGTGRDRIYTVTITSTDAAGNHSTKTTNVMVPHDMSIAGRNKNQSTVVATDAFIPLNAKTIVMPNPSSQSFTLQMGNYNNEKVEVRLLDITGKMVSLLYTGKNKTIQFGHNLRPGMYIVDIAGENKQHRKIKIIKQ